VKLVTLSILPNNDPEKNALGTPRCLLRQRLRPPLPPGLVGTVHLTHPKVPARKPGDVDYRIDLPLSTAATPPPFRTGAVATGDHGVPPSARAATMAFPNRCGTARRGNRSIRFGALEEIRSLLNLRTELENAGSETAREATHLGRRGRTFSSTTRCICSTLTRMEAKGMAKD
jgi:hypothetical protein